MAQTAGICTSLPLSLLQSKHPVVLFLLPKPLPHSANHNINSTKTPSDWRLWQTQTSRGDRDASATGICSLSYTFILPGFIMFQLFGHRRFFRRVAVRNIFGFEIEETGLQHPFFCIGRLDGPSSVVQLLFWKPWLVSWLRGFWRAGVWMPQMRLCYGSVSRQSAVSNVLNDPSRSLVVWVCVHPFPSPPASASACSCLRSGSTRGAGSSPSLFLWYWRAVYQGNMTGCKSCWHVNPAYLRRWPVVDEQVVLPLNVITEQRRSHGNEEQWQSL